MTYLQYAQTTQALHLARLFLFQAKTDYLRTELLVR